MSADKYFVQELRSAINNLAQNSTGDFPQELADWLLANGHLVNKDEDWKRQVEHAQVTRQRDDAWRRLSTLEREAHGLRKQVEQMQAERAA